ncbi:membrane protein IgaA [Escherichia coli]|uniref:Membrane protein IgaA n=1 Tax=Escherichia coli TaxID=562 RepID=A0A376MKW0_ECOLX|nr:membrane protein IgaA [Escherichia coli]
MSTIVIFLAALLACSLLAGWLIKVRSRRRQLPWTNAFADAQTRKLTPEEHSAVENYLESLTQVLQVPGPTGASAAPISLALNAESNNVMMLTHAITRYGISTDDPNKWRYYLDSVEVHLPPFWEQYINDENTVELIHTDSLPLVISLNGHTLQEYMQETRGYALQPVPSTQASIRGEESEQIELLNIRKETHEEYALSRPRGLREALLIVASFLMFFFCLITPDVFVPWLAGGALLLLGAGLWGYSRPRQNPPCGKFIACAVHPVVGDCLAKTIRNRSTIFHSVLSTWSTPHTGSHTLLRISVNKPISISISTAT